MTDDLLQNKIDGLKSKIEALEDDKEVFIKAKTLQEQIDQGQEDIISLKSDITDTKKDLAELKDKKTDAVKKTSVEFEKTMSEILPGGKAVFRIDDDGLFIGWDIGYHIPYEGLSGGERVMFDSALSHALMGQAKNKVIILEGSELDENNLTSTLNHLQQQDPDAQIIVNHWHGPKHVPPDWNVIVLK